MSLGTFDAILYAIVFLVPGFVWSWMHSKLIPRRAQAWETRALEFLTLSCINHALWIGFILPLFRSGFSAYHPFWLILPLFISPVTLGFLSGWAYQKKWNRRILGRLGLKTIHPIPTAWDYHFSRARYYWVKVRLRDGTNVYGWFGCQSFAGDDPHERDLYIEAAYRPNEHGEWVPIEDSGGIIVKADQIAAIEFRKDAEENYDD
ncbi:MAG: DUF6338 family protein [Planctomycetota bacterium]